MNYISKDILFLLALQLDLPDMMNFCRINKRIYNSIYQKNYIWNWKLKEEFPNCNDSLLQKTPKNTYILIYNLRSLICKFNLNYSTEELYFSKILHLGGYIIKKIPKEIVFLINLKRLNLSACMLEKIPKEICSLIDLKYLDLSYNLIKEIPKELCSLINLKYLNLSYNLIEEISSMSTLVNLKLLRINNNPIKSISLEIYTLPNLEKLIQ